jgi:hypothetical protein
MTKMIISILLGIVSTISDNNVAVLAMSNFGIPLTGSMSIGFTIGFMKG